MRCVISLITKPDFSTIHRMGFIWKLQSQLGDRVEIRTGKAVALKGSKLYYGKLPVRNRSVSRQCLPKFQINKVSKVYKCQINYSC